MLDVYYKPAEEGPGFFETILPNFLKNTEALLEKRGGTYFAGNNVK